MGVSSTHIIPHDGNMDNSIQRAAMIVVEYRDMGGFSVDSGLVGVASIVHNASDLQVSPGGMIHWVGVDVN